MLLSSHALIMTLSLLAAPGDTAAAPKVTDEMLGRVIRERAVWENNRLGITNKIPPPWTPMTVSGKRIACWGRSYDYAESLFPKDTASQGAEILAGPIALVARLSGKDVAIQKADKQVLAAAPHQVDLDASAAAEASADEEGPTGAYIGRHEHDDFRDIAGRARRADREVRLCGAVLRHCHALPVRLDLVLPLLPRHARAARTT